MKCIRKFTVANHHKRSLRTATGTVKPEDLLIHAGNHVLFGAHNLFSVHNFTKKKQTVAKVYRFCFKVR